MVGVIDAEAPTGVLMWERTHMQMISHIQREVITVTNENVAGKSCG